MRGEELTLYGTGEQTRSFCYVDDLVDGMVRLMNADGRTLPVNLGNPVEFTIKELAEEVVKTVGGKTRVTYRPLPEDDPTQRQPDITRAREWLGWEPRVPLADGLVRTVEYFKSRLARRNRAAMSKIDESGSSQRMLD
jgi:UDP-glucuronate decarboxylase